MANVALNRSVVLVMTNKSGGSVAQGDVVVWDTTTASSCTTTTTSAYAAEPVGVVIEPNGIANNATGRVVFQGYTPIINLSASASLGDFVKTHTVAKQGVRHATPSVAGDFAVVLATGATPAAFLFGTSFVAGGGGGTDSNAIHVSTSSEISGITEKTAPVGADLIVIEDSAASNAKKRVQMVNAGFETPWFVQINAAPPRNADSGNWTLTYFTDNGTARWDYAIQSSGGVNDYVEWKVLLGPGTWELYFQYVKNNNNGIYTVALDGSSLGTVDAYNASGVFTSTLISSISVAVASNSNLHLLRFTMATKNGSSSNYYAQLSQIQLRRTA